MSCEVNMRLPLSIAAVFSKKGTALPFADAISSFTLMTRLAL